MAKNDRDKSFELDGRSLEEQLASLDALSGDRDQEAAGGSGATGEAGSGAPGEASADSGSAPGEAFPPNPWLADPEPRPQAEEAPPTSYAVAEDSITAGQNPWAQGGPVETPAETAAEAAADATAKASSGSPAESDPAGPAPAPTSSAPSTSSVPPSPMSPSPAPPGPGDTAPIRAQPLHNPPADDDLNSRTVRVRRQGPASGSDPGSSGPSGRDRTVGLRPPEGQYIPLGGPETAPPASGSDDPFDTYDRTVGLRPGRPGDAHGTTVGIRPGDGQYAPRGGEPPAGPPAASPQISYEPQPGHESRTGGPVSSGPGSPASPGQPAGDGGPIQDYPASFTGRPFLGPAQPDFQPPPAPPGGPAGAAPPAPYDPQPNPYAPPGQPGGPPFSQPNPYAPAEAPDARPYGQPGYPQGPGTQYPADPGSPYEVPPVSVEPQPPAAPNQPPPGQRLPPAQSYDQAPYEQREPFPHGYGQQPPPPGMAHPGMAPPGMAPGMAPGMPPAPGQLPPHPQAPPPQRPENADSLNTAALLGERRSAPASGWRKLIYKASVGMIQPGESPAEVRRQELITRARTQVAGGHHRVAVLSLKGGVGKTTTTVGLGATLASIRGDRVIAVDANPDRGTLSDKVRLETAATVRDLLNERQHVQRYADVRAFTSQAPSRLEVLASDRDPAVSEAFSDKDYRHVAKVLEHYYSICLTDCGTGLLHSAMGGVLGLADQIVLVSSPSVDGARSASATLDWLEAHDHSGLVRNAVVVLSAVRPKSKSGVDLDRLEAHFAARCRGVVRIPYDPHLEEGAEVDLDELSPATQEAYLLLAATVGAGFARQ